MTVQLFQVSGEDPFVWPGGPAVLWSGRSALGTPPSPVPGRPLLTLVGLGPTPHTVAAASCSPRTFTRQSVSRVREWAPLCCAWTTKAGVSMHSWASEDRVAHFPFRLGYASTLLKSTGSDAEAHHAVVGYREHARRSIRSALPS